MASTATGFQSCGEAISHRWRGRSAKTVLLSAVIAAVALYIVGDVVSALLYDGYSYRDQAISELSAFGSPVRGLMASVILLHGVLVTAFGVGVWRSADRRGLRLTGLFMVAAGLVGFPTHTVFAMSSRGMESGFNDAMHIVLSGVYSIFVAAAMVTSAVAYRGWFRRYAIADAPDRDGLRCGGLVRHTGGSRRTSRRGQVDSSESTPTPTLHGSLCWQ